MKIDILSETTLKLTLTADDMNKHKLRYESLSKNVADCKECREVLGEILKTDSMPESRIMAEQLLGESRRLFIEAFKRMDGGCMLYVSAPERRGKGHRGGILDKSEKASPIIFETDFDGDMGAFCRCLISERKKGSVKFKSRLFFDGKTYRLALIPLGICKARILRLMNEYGSALTDELTAAFTEEHFKTVSPEDGAETGSRIF